MTTLILLSALPAKPAEGAKTSSAPKSATKNDHASGRSKRQTPEGGELDLDTYDEGGKKAAALIARSPQAVQRAFRRGREAVKKAAKTPWQDVGITLGFEPIFWKSAAGYRGHAQAWLVGYLVARQNRALHAVIQIIDSSGRPLFEFEDPRDEGFFDSGLPFKTTHCSAATFVVIAPGESVLALTRMGRRGWETGELKLYVLEPQWRRLLVDYGYIQGGSSAELSWESMYYFIDVDGDGRKEILINRRASQRTDTMYQNQKLVDSMHLNQKLVFELKPGSLQPVHVTKKYNRNLLKLFQWAKKDRRTPSAPQYGPATEKLDDFGEAIHPGEEQWRDVKYEDVRAPDLKPQDSMLPVIEKRKK